MAENRLGSLAKQTAIYGLSSIIGRFLNYMLVPIHTHRMAAESGGYGIVTNLYAYTALLLVILTFGMETTFFRRRFCLAGFPHLGFSILETYRWSLGLCLASRICGNHGHHRGF